MKNKDYLNNFVLIGWIFSWLFLLIPFLMRIYLPINPQNEDYIFITTTIILFINFILYINIFKNKYSFKKLFSWLLILSAFLFFIIPLTSTDTNYYISSARVFTEHNLNPYVDNYKELTTDSLYKQISTKWSYLSSTYGPLFTIFSFAITWIAKSSYFLSLYLFKFFTAAAFLFSSYLIYKITDSKKMFFLFSFNPLIIFEFLVNSHNDIFMILFILLAFYYIIKKPLTIKYALLSILMLVFSGLIKYISFVLIPIFFIIIVKKLNKDKDKIIFFFSSFFISLGSIFLFYLPFWSIEIIQRLKAQSAMTGTLITSPVIAISNLFFHIFNINNYGDLIILISRLLFFISYLIILFIIIKKKNLNLKKTIIDYSFLSILLLILFFFSWMPPWYYTILLTLIYLKITYSKVIKQKYLIRASYLITLIAILNYIIIR